MDNNEHEVPQKSKTNKAKTIGIVILIIVALPLLFFGTCILLLNGSFN